MKSRRDFVSNSSSCSFVIAGEKDAVADGLRFFAQVMSEAEFDADMDQLSVSVVTRYKWCKNVLRSLGREDEYDPEMPSRVWDPLNRPQVSPDDAYDIACSMDDLVRIGLDESTLLKIDEVRFSCQDSDRVGVLYLTLLYRFFERNECCPDASDTEQFFLDDDNALQTMRLLSATCRGDAGKRGKKRKFRKDRAR